MSESTPIRFKRPVSPPPTNLMSEYRKMRRKMKGIQNDAENDKKILPSLLYKTPNSFDSSSVQIPQLEKRYSLWYPLYPRLLLSHDSLPVKSRSLLPLCPEECGMATPAVVPC